MIEAYSEENPYWPVGPVSDSSMFVGREVAFSWIRANLGHDSPRRPLILHGRPGIGKSSILKQIENGRLGDDTLFVFADMSRLPTDNLSGFIWSLTKSAMQSLEAQSLWTPQPEKRMFLIGPRRVFWQHFWQPLLDRADGRHLLFSLDNVDVLSRGSSESSFQDTVLDFLHSLHQSSRVDFLFTIGGRLEGFAEHSLPPFDLSLGHRVAGLTLLESLALIRRPVPYRVFREVGTHIHKLTGGHPGDMQRLCHALYERCKRLRIRQATLADVTAVLNSDLHASDFRTPVFRRYASISVQLTADKPS